MTNKEQLFEAGMLSVTFRKLSVEKIVELSAQAGLDVIGWGGDIHVPHGETAVAAATARMTADAGLGVAGYASYYRAGDEPDGTFDKVLESALALGAPSIRVWAGRLGSAAADEAARGRVVEDARRIAEQAAASGLTVEFEFHGNTLTDTIDSTIRLMEEIGSPHVRSCWQPPLHISVEERAEGLKRLLPWLSTLHVFHWAGSERQSLADGAEEWTSYLDLIRPLRTRRSALLEFVRNDDPEQFLRDATALKALLAKFGQAGE